MYTFAYICSKLQLPYTHLHGHLLIAVWVFVHCCAAICISHLPSVLHHGCGMVHYWRGNKMHCHSTFCVHFWLCPAVPPTGKSGGGGSTSIAVIGKIVMTSVSMSLICIWKAIHFLLQFLHLWSLSPSSCHRHNDCMYQAKREDKWVWGGFGSLWVVWVQYGLLLCLSSVCVWFTLSLFVLSFL